MKIKNKLVLKTIAWVALVSFVSGCSSTTVIRSIPEGAKLYVNGEPKGTTPYTLTDKRIVGSDNAVTLKKDGYEDFNTVFSRDEEFSVGACIGGVFLLVPFLWIMKYKPEHVYELKPLSKSSEPTKQTEPTTSPSAQ